MKKLNSRTSRAHVIYSRISYFRIRLSPNVYIHGGVRVFKQLAATITNRGDHLPRVYVRVSEFYAANWSGRLEFMKFVRASEDLIGKQLDYIRTRYVFTTDELCANPQ